MYVASPYSIHLATQHHSKYNIVRGLHMGYAWKINNMPTLSEFPAEVDDQLQQQQTDRQEQQQAEQPERKKAVCLSVRLCDGLSKEQSHISPGATQNLHTAPAWEEQMEKKGS